MSEGDVAAAVAQLRAGVDALLGAPVEGLAATELASVLEAVEVQRRRLEAVDQRLLAAASTAGGAAAFGQAGVADVLTSLLRIDPREARARVGRAGDLGPRRALTGGPLEPLLPVTAAAVAAGAVSAAQTEVIVDCGADPARRAGGGRAGRGTVAGRGGPVRGAAAGAPHRGRATPPPRPRRAGTGRGPGRPAPQLHPGHETRRHQFAPGVVDGGGDRVVGGDPGLPGRPATRGGGAAG